MDVVETDGDEASDSEGEADEEDDEFVDEPMRSLIEYQNRRKKDTTKPYNLIASMWYLMIESLSTVLKVLAPVTILSWFYGHDSLVFRILLQCDKTIRSVISPKHEERDELLRWLQEIFPNDERTKSLDNIWEDGSLICDIVESVIPGSCPGHLRGQKVDLSHAQRLAEQYLGISPMFSNEELAHKFLTTYKECKLAHYLTNIREALAQLSPPISRCGSPILNAQAFTLDYVARGMGLIGAVEGRKAIFYIYPTAQQSVEPGDISVQIKGPDSGYGSTLVPALYGRTHIVKSVLANMAHRAIQSPPVFIGSNACRGKFTSNVKNEIDVSVVVKNDKIKVTYVPVKRGHHELSLISRGCHVVGSPFRINADSRTSSGSRRYYMYDEDDVPTEKPQTGDRKVVFRIVDFVTEKMILGEDGQLEKLSENEAKKLLHTVESIENMKRLNAIKDSQSDDEIVEVEDTQNTSERNHHHEHGKNYFRHIGEKVSLLLRFCRELKTGYYFRHPSPKPDIINMTLNEESSSAMDMRRKFRNKHSSFNKTDAWVNDDYQEDTTDESNSANCPVLSQAASIDIVVTSFDDDEDVDAIAAKEIRVAKETIVPFERPKTPVYKILCDVNEAKSDIYHGFDKDQYEGQFDSLNGEEIERCFSQSVDINQEFDDTSRATTVIDFHIGEAVTPTPMTSMGNYANSEVDMDSIILASNLEEALLKYDKKIQGSSLNSGDSCPSKYSTPFRQTPFELMTDNEIMSLYETPLAAEDVATMLTVEQNVYSNTAGDSGENSLDGIDSAYMSIDEVNSSTDTNSSTPKSDGSCSKMKLYSIEESVDDYCNMGPAEKEIWEAMNEDEEKMQESDNSSSDAMADEELSDSNVPTISSIQNAEFQDRNLDCTDDASRGSQSGQTPNNSPSMERTPIRKSLSKMVSEKKEYWDEKISAMKAEELKISFSPKRIPEGDRKIEKSKSAETLTDKNYNRDHNREIDTPSPSEKLVEKWKNYWNDKLEKCSTPDFDMVYMHKEVTKTRRFLASPDADEIDAIFYNKKTDSIVDCKNDFKTQVEEKCDTDVKNYDIEQNSKVVTGLSKRIDTYLKTMSVGENGDGFSTPDIKCSNVPVQQISNATEESTNGFQSITKSPSPDVQKNDELSPGHIKSKIDNYNKATSGRSTFALTRSYTSDIPRMASFKKLQKYFSVDNVDKCAEADEFFAEDITIFDDETDKNDEKVMEEKSISTDSLPTLSEKKAVIELHLQSIQKRMNSNKLSPPECKPETNMKNLVKIVPDATSENSFCDIQSEIKQISKPISSIVAKFENHMKSNEISLAKDAVYCEGTNKNEKAKSSQTTVKKNNEKLKNVVEKLKQNSIPENDDHNRDDLIQSPTHKESFRKAISFFQNLNNARQNSKDKRPNECQKMLLENDKRDLSPKKVIEIVAPPRKKRAKDREKIKTKAYSIATTDAVIQSNNNRLTKISEKFLVDDLFKDIAGDSFMFKGIPHKNAVLAAFNSMEDIDQPSSYDERSHQENHVKINERISQKYYSEFPYLPIMDPSKSKPRTNLAAWGLMKRRDFLRAQKSRRNSAPSSLSLVEPSLTNS